MKIEVRLFATLRDKAPAGSKKGVFFSAFPEKSTVADVLSSLHITPVEVHMIMINGVLGTIEDELKDEDRIGLFPPVGGG